MLIEIQAHVHVKFDGGEAVHYPGQVTADLPDAEAVKLIEAGKARPVKAEPETAALEPTETADLLRRKRR